MTMKYELTKAYHKKKTIYKCIKCNHIWLYSCDDKIESHIPEDYKEFSHGLCKDCFIDVSKDKEWFKKYTKEHWIKKLDGD